MTQVLIFGASLVQGYWDLQGGWVQRLRTFVDKKNLQSDDYYCSIFNLGISGNTSDELLRRIENEIKPRILESKETIVLICIGINDSAFNNKTKSNQVKPKKFESNLKSLIKISRKFTNQIVFIGLTKVNEQLVNPCPWDTDISYLNKNILEYNEIVKKVCLKENILFVNLEDSLSKLNWNAFLVDGCHPGSQGHQKIFEIVKSFLIEKKLIR